MTFRAIQKSVLMSMYSRFANYTNISGLYQVTKNHNERSNIKNQLTINNNKVTPIIDNNS